MKSVSPDDQPDYSEADLEFMRSADCGMAPDPEEGHHYWDRKEYEPTTQPYVAAFLIVTFLLSLVLLAVLG